MTWFPLVTLPDGVTAGQTIHVQAPDGRLNAIVVPPGFGPGSTFTVEFAPEEAPVPTAPVATSAPVATPATEPQYVQITVPDNVKAGDTIHVQAPDGTTNAIVIPDGYGPGSNLTVQVTSGGDVSSNNNHNTATPYVVPPNPQRPDDGFASGFGSAPTATPVYPDSKY